MDVLDTDTDDDADGMLEIHPFLCGMRNLWGKISRNGTNLHK